MAPTPAGDLVVSSASNNDLVVYDGEAGGALAKHPNVCPGSFTQAVDVTVGPDGEFYTACGPTDGIRRFDEIGVSQTFVMSGSGGLTSPRALVFGPGGNLFVSSLTGEVLEYDGTTGAFVGVFVDATGNGGGALDPYGLLFHGSSLFVASFFPSEVKEFDAGTGAFVQTFVPSGSGGLSGPTSLAFGPGGDLYVTSVGNDSIKRYDGVNGAFVETFVAPGSGGLDDPVDLYFAAPEIPVPAAPAAARALAGLALAAAALRRLRAGARPGRPA
jgi:WD40 repeat protein